MQKRLIHLEQELTRNLEEAAESAKNSSSTGDKFQEELQQSMNWLAFTMPSILQKDGVTVKETIPFMRKVEVTSESSGEPGRKKHRLVKEVRPGKLVLHHPIIYQIKKGDNLSNICRSIAGGQVSVADLKRWNPYLEGDTIHPGKALWLADPNDELVKAISGRFGEQTQRKNPEIDLERLGPELANKYAGVMARQYQVQLQLQYDEDAGNFLNPALFGGAINSNGYNGPWAPEPTAMPDFGTSSFTDQFLPGGSGFGNGQDGLGLEYPGHSGGMQADLGLNVPLALWSIGSYAYGINENMRALSIAGQEVQMLKQLKNSVRLKVGRPSATDRNLARMITKNNKILEGMKLGAKRMVFVGTVIGLIDIANANPEDRANKAKWLAADTTMGVIGLTGWGTIPAGFYFAGRFAYGLYDLATTEED